MTSHALPVLTTLFLWWFSTGLILYLDRLPQRTFRFSMTGGTLLAGLALYALPLVSADRSAAGAYGGFAIGLVLWGWLELGFYMGFMVGPRREAAAEPVTGLRRLRHAIEVMLFHELAAVAVMAGLAAISWDSPNKLALWTVLILWGMQLSAKLNVFLGVPNLNEDFLPAHLAFLRHYMTRKPMNLFFPLSLTGSVVLATWLVSAAAAADTPESIGLTMLASLVVLAVVEHWFLVLPLPAEALWAWYLAKRTARSGPRVRRAGLFGKPGPSSLVSPLISRRPT